MIDFLTNTIWGWLGIGGAIIAAALAIAWFVPPFRRLALTVASVAAGVLFVYAKGASDAKRREREKSEKAVAKRQAEYGRIDNRADGPDAVAKRMRDGTF